MNKRKFNAIGMPVRESKTKKTARFWVYWNEGYVKLSLRPGESLTACHGDDTDEGYLWRSVTYTNDGAACVTCEIDSWGRDCDGRFETHVECECPVTQLAIVPADEWGPARPEWRKVNANQRDYSAEAMGY